MKRMLETKSREHMIADAHAGEHQLHRVLGPLHLVFLGIGCVIGAGIFVLTGQAAAQYAGPAIALAGFPARLEREVGLTVEPRSLGAIEVSPGALDGVDGAQLTVAAGLAIDEVGQ